MEAVGTVLFTVAVAPLTSNPVPLALAYKPGVPVSVFTVSLIGDSIITLSASPNQSFTGLVALSAELL